LVKLGVQRKTKIIRVRIEPYLYALLRKRAMETGRSVSEIVRFYLRRELKNEERR